MVCSWAHMGEEKEKTHVNHLHDPLSFIFILLPLSFFIARALSLSSLLFPLSLSPIFRSLILIIHRFLRVLSPS
ncbi:hypothetical protein RJT34_29236 [Clitoria ternatea]|uniref:Uncharacterized protein n=1 Tax=Clitoria ternatea TaxID=43366 RepID=A0AAN9F9T3_CLITE